MNRNHSILRFTLSLSTNPSLLFCAVSITILLILSSCDTGSKGRYKFQSESMHWLQFRGPNGSGIAPENAHPPIHFSADTNMLWKTEVLPGWSSPCIVNDRIFLTGFDDTDSLLYTLAINRENGEILWKNFVTPDEYYELHPINTFANPTVASDGERIFSSFPNYGLIAYDLEDYDIWRLMIDIKHQGNGYGKKAMELVLNILRKDKRLKTARTSINVDNHVMRSLIEGFGFKESGKILRRFDDGDPEEIEFELKL